MGNCCKKKELDVFSVSKGDESRFEGDEGKGNENEILDGVELSLNSMVGLSKARTLKLKGEVHGLQVVGLVDYGATQNFISTSLVETTNSPSRDFPIWCSD